MHSCLSIKSIVNTVTILIKYGYQLYYKTFEQLHDKINKMTFVPSERLAWASAQFDQSLPSMHEEALGPRLPINFTAKTDQTGQMPRLILSLPWAHSSFCWFCHAAAHFSSRQLGAPLCTKTGLEDGDSSACVFLPGSKVSGSYNKTV